MDKMIQYIRSIFFVVIILQVSSCSTRMDQPEQSENSPLFYTLKNGNKVIDDISFCRRIDRETEELIGEGNEFIIMEDGRIQAVVFLNNYIIQNDKISMFHFDWISESGKSTYLKRDDYTPNDTIDFIKSSISITPELRLPGEYKLRVYYFRELIAEKSFILLPEFDPSTFNLEILSENLLLCKSISKKTGDAIGVDSVFRMKKKGSMRALFTMDDFMNHDQRELLYSFDWYAKGDTTPFYKKRVDILSRDSSDKISASISITPDKREAGSYSVILNLFGKPIAQKYFELLPPLDFSAVKTDIIFYKKKSKKSGKLIGKGTVFEIGKKKKVRASVKVSGLGEFINQELELRLRWVGPDGKSVYSKSYNIIPDKSSKTLTSAISITPGKRKVGEYSLQVYLSDELIREQKFGLRPEK